jgi:hypothetical protein
MYEYRNDVEKKVKSLIDYTLKKSENLKPKNP